VLDSTPVPSSPFTRPPKARGYVVPVVRPLPAPRPDTRAARAW
jgi:hypothetical protein